MPTAKLSRKTAIKEKCLDCSSGIRAEVRRCPATGCPLWPFRMGTAKPIPANGDGLPDREKGTEPEEDT